MKQMFTSPFPLLRSLLLCPVLALTACGGGGGSGGGSNGGQQPDPVVVDIPIAYIQRPLPAEGEQGYPDVFRPDSFNPGGELYLKARATAQAEVVNISRCAFERSDACSTESDLIQNDDYNPQNPNYDVKDVAVSEDGKKLVFALHEPDVNPDDDEGPTWNIWEYELETKKLARVIRSEFEREKGDDVSPRYLPTDDIIFSSNRQKRSKEILLDEGKPQFSAVTTQNAQLAAFNLHSVRPDGTNIQQLTYNQSHDIQPSIMPDGRVLFMRWKEDQLSFYTSNPDGTDVQRYFGNETLNKEPGDNMTEAPRLLRPQVMPDGRIASIYLQNGQQLGGDMVVVDGRTAIEIEGDIEKISLKPVDISTDRVPLSGRFASLSPLYDNTNRLLVSWSQCRLQESETLRLQPCLPTLLTDVVTGESGIPIEGYQEAPPFYGLWIYNITNQTQLPVVLAEEGKIFTEAITLAPRSFGDRASEIDPVLAQEDVGVLDIRSVYDFDGNFVNLEEKINLPPDQRPARFVRITKAVSVMDGDLNNDVDPDEKLYLRVIGDNEDLKEILGYAPIEPDGSVKVRVPADVAFSLEILDANGRQISDEHTTLLQLRPGEVLECNGCHVAGSSNPHGRRELEAASININNPGGEQFGNTQRFQLDGNLATPEPTETMAQFANRSFYKLKDASVVWPVCASSDPLCPLRKLSVDLDFTDEWTQSMTQAEAIEKNTLWSYNQLSDATPDEIAAPTTVACRDNWHPLCRIVINYEYHIQPLWELERLPIADVDIGGQPVMVTTCVGCHSTSDFAGNPDARVPSGQLQLTRVKVDDVMTSFSQLTEGRPVQHLLISGENATLVTEYPACEYEDENDWIPQCEVIFDEDGVPTCDGVDECLFQRDPVTDALVLDDDGNPKPEKIADDNTSTVLTQDSNSNLGNNPAFFSRFERYIPAWNATESYAMDTLVHYDPSANDDIPGRVFRARVANAGSVPNVNAPQTNEWERLDARISADTVDHRKGLNRAELKLLSEWLDTGGRYYTNPFELAIPN
jgi:hypothetical protein